MFGWEAYQILAVGSLLNETLATKRYLIIVVPITIPLSRGVFLLLDS